MRSLKDKWRQITAFCRELSLQPQTIQKKKKKLMVFEEKVKYLLFDLINNSARVMKRIRFGAYSHVLLEFSVCFLLFFS